MDKRTAKAAEQKIAALAGAPSGEDAHAQAKAAFEAAVEKTRQQTGKDPLKAMQEESAEPDEKIEIEVVKSEKDEAPAPKAKPKKAKAPEPDRYAALERQIVDLSKRLEEKAKPEKAEPPKPDRLAEAHTFLKEKFGDEEGEALAHVLKYVLSPLQEQQESLNKSLRDALERGQKQFAKSARKSLGEQYERLKASDDAWEMVKSQGDALIAKDAERFASPEEAYAHVAESLYGAPDEAEEAEEEEPEDNHAEEVSSAEVTSPTRTRSERKLTPKERQFASFKHLLKHPDDVIGASRIARLTYG